MSDDKEDRLNVGNGCEVVKHEDDFELTTFRPDGLIQVVQSSECLEELSEWPGRHLPMWICAFNVAALEAFLWLLGKWSTLVDNDQLEEWYQAHIHATKVYVAEVHGLRGITRFCSGLGADWDSDDPHHLLRGAPSFLGQSTPFFSEVFQQKLRQHPYTQWASDIDRASFRWLFTHADMYLGRVGFDNTRNESDRSDEDWRLYLSPIALFSKFGHLQDFPVSEDNKKDVVTTLRALTQMTDYCSGMCLVVNQVKTWNGEKKR